MCKFGQGVTSRVEKGTVGYGMVQYGGIGKGTLGWGREIICANCGSSLQGELNLYQYV